MTERSSMGCFGCCAAGVRGRTFQSGTASGRDLQSVPTLAQSGLWQQLLEKVIEQADAACKVNWHAHYLDATIVKAHQHAAGAKKVTLPTKR
jgi:hypothetical protein